MKDYCKNSERDFEALDQGSDSESGKKGIILKTLREYR